MADGLIAAKRTGNQSRRFGNGRRARRSNHACPDFSPDFSRFSPFSCRCKLHDMRLSSRSHRIIRETVAEIFGPNAQVLLFGSRLDDRARGGDIDLLVKLDRPDPESLRKELTLIARLQRRLGDQPIDVLLIEPGKQLSQIHAIALDQGVRL